MGKLNDHPFVAGTGDDALWSIICWGRADCRDFPNHIQLDVGWQGGRRLPLLESLAFGVASSTRSPIGNIWFVVLVQVSLALGRGEWIRI